MDMVKYKICGDSSYKLLTVPYFPESLVQKTFGNANLTPSPTLKLSTLPLPPNSSTTKIMYLSSF